MQNDQGISISLNFGENGTTYGCGHSLDTCLYAFGLTTEQDTYEYNGDAEHDAVERTLKSFDFDEYTLNKLNDMKETDVLNLLLEMKIEDLGVINAQEIRDSDYLPGDWLKINKRHAFEAIVSNWQSRYMEIARDEIGAWPKEELPESLLNDLETSVQGEQEEIHNDWLNGDRSNPGALERLIKLMFDSRDTNRIQWDMHNDSVDFFNITEDEIREFYAYDLEDDQPIPPKEEIEKYIKKWILNKAYDRKKYEENKRKTRQEEWERQQQIKQAEAEQEKERAKERKTRKFLSN